MRGKARREEEEEGGVCKIYEQTKSKSRKERKERGLPFSSFPFRNLGRRKGGENPRRKKNKEERKGGEEKNKIWPLSGVSGGQSFTEGQ